MPPCSFHQVSTISLREEKNERAHWNKTTISLRQGKSIGWKLYPTAVYSSILDFGCRMLQV